MAYKLPTTIGTSHLQKLTKYTHSGTLHLFVEKGGIFRRPRYYKSVAHDTLPVPCVATGDPKYIVICKTSAEKCEWNMCCYAETFAEKAEINYSMLEFESVKEYEKDDIIGFTMKFEEPTKKPLIFRCDTKESRNKWMEHVLTAIQEAHKDSGYSTDTDRQSKKYETIDDVDNSEFDKPHSTDAETTRLDNISQAIAGWQVKTGVAGAAAGRDSEPNATEECDDVAKHSYENMMAENNSFKSFKRNASCKEQRETAIEGRHIGLDETYVKEVISHPVQETEKDTRNDESLAKSHKKRKPKKKFPAKKCPQAVTSSDPAIETDHIYENVAHSSLAMENLKLEFPPQDDNSVDCSHTDVKEVYRGETGRTKSIKHDAKKDSIKHDAKKDKVICELKLKFNERARDALIEKGFIKASIKSNISESGSTSSSESESLPESPVSRQESPCLTSVTKAENTVLKLPFASSPASAIGVSSSFISVQDCSKYSNAGSKSFVSVEGGTNDSATASSFVRKRHVHTKTAHSDSFSSTKENRTCSSLTRAKTFASSHGRRIRSSPLHSATHTHVQEMQILSISKDSASFASVREDGTCSSSTPSSLTTPKSIANQSLDSRCVRGGKQTRSTSIDSASLTSVRNSPMSFSPVTPESSVTVSKEDVKLSLHKSKTCATTGGDEEVIYENTDTCYATENRDYRRQESESSRDSNSSNLHSTNSSSSFSSRDSNASLKVYESPDESAHYENTEFLREEYFCEEKIKVKQMLENKSVGTFLVCPGEPHMEMCVKTPVGIKYFRIREQEDKWSLFKDFSNTDYVHLNLDSLLFYYHIHELPSKDYKVKLEKGYKSKDVESG